MKNFKGSDSELQSQKDAEFYAANLNAWFTSSIERDKNLLTLSSGAIGILVTLLSTVGIQEQYQLYLYIPALFCFLTCIVLVLKVFKANQKHIEQVIQGFEGFDVKLKIIDTSVNLAFGIGVTLSILIGITAAFHSNIERIERMSKNTKTTGVVVANDSVNGLSTLKPNTILQKSVNGASQLKPTPNQNSQNPPTQNDNKGK